MISSLVVLKREFFGIFKCLLAKIFCEQFVRDGTVRKAYLIASEDLGYQCLVRMKCLF
jgi:hypothetical protein